MDRQILAAADRESVAKLVGSVMSSHSKDAPATGSFQTASSSHTVQSGKPGREDKQAGKPPQAKKAERRKIALISSSDLMQDSLLAHFREGVDADIAVFRSVDDWMRQADAASYSLIVLHAHGDRLGREIARLDQFPGSPGGCPPFVVLGDSEWQGDVVTSIRRGARGYIPTSVSLELMIDVIRFVFIGGVYCPPYVGQGSR
jgi:hypothetical protein